MRQRITIAVMAFLAMATAAAGQEVCVACTEPAKTYRCQIAAGSGEAALKRAPKLAQLACITELARRGGHATCAVNRDGFSSCLGDIELVSATAAALAGPPASATDAAAGRPAPSDPALKASQTAKSTDGPPATMAELVRRTGEASKRQLEKTGDAIGDAMKKSWRCISSLFTRC